MFNVDCCLCGCVHSISSKSDWHAKHLARSLGWALVMPRLDLWMCNHCVTYSENLCLNLTTRCDHPQRRVTTRRAAPGHTSGTSQP